MQDRLIHHLLHPRAYVITDQVIRFINRWISPVAQEHKINSLSGSIHTQVPVKPVCPNTEAGASGLQGLLSVCSASGLSKPKPRRLSRDFNVVKSSQVARLRYLRSPQIPLSSHICAILATSCVVENKPAFPDTPPIKAAAHPAQIPAICPHGGNQSLQKVQSAPSGIYVRAKGCMTQSHRGIEYAIQIHIHWHTRYLFHHSFSSIKFRQL